MGRVVTSIRAAEAYSANDCQSQMLQRYAASFELGSIEEHKEGSRHWIQDKGPIIESYIGFIESYRGACAGCDPNHTFGITDST